MLNVYDSDDEACWYLMMYHKILQFIPGLTLLIADPNCLFELAYVTQKVSFFRVYAHICAFGGANNGDRWLTPSITQDQLLHGDSGRDSGELWCHEEACLLTICIGVLMSVSTDRWWHCSAVRGRWEAGMSYHGWSRNTLGEFSSTLCSFCISHLGITSQWFWHF